MHIFERKKCLNVGTIASHLFIHGQASLDEWKNNRLATQEVRRSNLRHAIIFL